MHMLTLKISRMKSNYILRNENGENSGKSRWIQIIMKWSSATSATRRFPEISFTPKSTKAAEIVIRVENANDVKHGAVQWSSLYVTHIRQQLTEMTQREKMEDEDMNTMWHLSLLLSSYWTSKKASVHIQTYHLSQMVPGVYHLNELMLPRVIQQIMYALYVAAFRAQYAERIRRSGQKKK